MSDLLSWIEANALVITIVLAAAVILLVVLLILINVKRSAKWRAKEFENNKESELLKARISDLEKESIELHDREKQLLAERDDILMAAHEKADDILEQTMERVQRSEAQIRQNRIIASCCITDARRKISDLMIDVSRRLVDDTTLMDAQEITPQAVEEAEEKELLAAADYDTAIAQAAEGVVPDDEADETEPQETPDQDEVSFVVDDISPVQDDTMTAPDMPLDDAPSAEQVEEPVQEDV